MTVSHLALATGMTLYILVGIGFEERDLVRRFGESYLRYQRSVPKLIPRLHARSVVDGRAARAGLEASDR